MEALHVQNALVSLNHEAKYELRASLKDFKEDL
jgi:hypothetical protein